MYVHNYLYLKHLKVRSNIIRYILVTMIKAGEGTPLMRLAGCLKAQQVMVSEGYLFFYATGLETE